MNKYYQPTLPETTCWGYDKAKAIKVEKLWDEEGVHKAISEAFLVHGVLWNPLINWDYIWQNVLTGRFIFEDETGCFSTETYGSASEANDALDQYVKEML